MFIWIIPFYGFCRCKEVGNLKEAFLTVFNGNKIDFSFVGFSGKYIVTSGK